MRWRCELRTKALRVGVGGWVGGCEVWGGVAGGVGEGLEEERAALARAWHL